MKPIYSITIKETKIPLHRKNLVIIGNNGSGKTFILNNIYSEIQKLVQDRYYVENEISRKRSNLINELDIAFRDFLNVLNLDKNILEDLKFSIQSYNTSDFPYLLNNLKIHINKKHKFFLAEYAKNLESQITDIYSTFNPKPTMKNSHNKKYYYENKKHLDFYIQDINKKISNFIDSTISVKLKPGYDLREKTPNLVINFFDAKRTSALDSTMSFSEISIYSNLDNLFEKYLIEQFKTNIPKNNNIKYDEFEYINQNNNWLSKVENDLKYIFEDKTTKISFDKIKDKILIFSEGKVYSLDSLSSGLQSIFKIYSSLLLRTKILNIEQNDLIGVVIIDEIDVHLHITLQKKVLPFLTKAFPQVQFIVSTHSPFVITSTDNDTVVYDISTNEFFEEDLSRYSYESVIKGLFHVNPISSDTKDSIEILKNLLTNNPSNYDNIRSIVKNLVELEKNDLLDKKLKNLYLQAINLLADNNQLEDLDV